MRQPISDLMRSAEKIPDAQRSLARGGPLPLHSAPLRRAVSRLHRLKPLVFTAIGQSNTVSEAGCFGSGCLKSTATGHLHDGWGTIFMHLLNATWPAAHAFYNRAFGAASPQAVTTCLRGHLAPHTDVLLVDFNVGNWTTLEQERLARTAALLPRPPLVVYLGFPNWCADEHVTYRLERLASRFAGETAEAANTRRRTASNRGYANCARKLKSGGFSRGDEVSSRLVHVARHYGHVLVSLYDLIEPLILAHHPAFDPPSRFTTDGTHGGRACGFFGCESAYYSAVSASLSHLVHTAARELPRDALAKDPLGGGGADVRSGLGSGLPPLMHAGAGSYAMLRCYEWLHPNLEPPAVVKNQSGAPFGAGWAVSEHTLQRKPKRKPGLLSLSRGDLVELALDVEAPAVCIGLTHLRSFEGMATVRAECAAGCECEPTVVDALYTSSPHSLFHTREVHATVPTRAADRTPCLLRLTNLGASRGSMRAKFRLSGVSLRRPERHGDAARPCGPTGGPGSSSSWRDAIFNRKPTVSGLEPH